MQVQPYLFFEGRCEEAIEFYRKAVGAEVVMMMRFNQSPDPTMCSAAVSGEKVMHATIRIGETTLMASDGRCGGNASFKGFALSIAAADEAEVGRLFAALGEGGQAVMPPMKTFYAKSFGMVTDKFGVMWMLIAS